MRNKENHSLLGELWAWGPGRPILELEHREAWPFPNHVTGQSRFGFLSPTFPSDHTQNTAILIFVLCINLEPQTVLM